MSTILLQIRAHLGLGLGCPIVGDHKYEHAAEIGPPQKLPGACLNRLGIRQSQVQLFYQLDWIERQGDTSYRVTHVVVEKLMLTSNSKFRHRPASQDKFIANHA